MDVHEFRHEAGLSTPLTERQAEAFYRRHVDGESRSAAADAMDTSASNVDNLERAARQKIVQAENLQALLDAVGYEHARPPAIGTCSACDEPAESLQPLDGDLDTLVCPDCAD